MSLLTPNAQRLLRALIIDGPAHRADLARALEVSRATVTNLTNTLQEGGWIEEIRDAPGSLKNPLGATVQLGVLASIVFRVDTCTIVLAHLDGRLLSELTLRDLPVDEPAVRLRAGSDLLARLLADNDAEASALRALHLAVDTQMDNRTGEIYSPHASRRWYGVNPREHFATLFDAPIYLQNTARLEGLAESMWGAGDAQHDLLYVDVSYGVTSSHVTSGVIRSGGHGGSGEIGHAVYDWNGPRCSCGNDGCVMQYVSVPALLRDYAIAAPEAADWPGFCALVEAGDEIAASLAQRAALVLGRTLITSCHLLDPDTVVLSGEVTRALPGFVDQVAETVHAGLLPLVGRNLTIAAAELVEVWGVTARAGIVSMRGNEAVIESGSAL